MYYPIKLITIWHILLFFSFKVTTKTTEKEKKNFTKI